jgi:hypothetical protein
MNKFLAILLGLSLSGCLVSVKDGKVPAKYVKQAQTLAGTYRGEFEKHPVDLTLSVADDGRVSLSAVDQNGQKELMSGCHSTIGNLVSADVKDNSLRSAYFHFYAGSCRVALGYDLEVHVLGKGKLEVRVVASTRREMVQEGQDCYGSGPYDRVCYPRYREVEMPASYYSGRFAR